MTGFVQAKPDKFQSFKATEYDNLSDDQVAELLRKSGVRVGPQKKPNFGKYVDLTHLPGLGEKEV